MATSARRITSSANPHYSRSTRDKNVIYTTTPKKIRTSPYVIVGKIYDSGYPHCIFISPKMPTKKSNLAAYQNISPDSGFPIVIHPHFNPNIKDHVPDEPLRKEITPPKDRAFFADPEKKALFSVAKAVDLTESIGTVLEGAQLSQLNEKQLDELAALVNERGVVFFRDQDLTTEQQVKLFEHYGE
jgi:hypothetical protein